MEGDGEVDRLAIVEGCLGPDPTAAIAALRAALRATSDEEAIALATHAALWHMHRAVFEDAGATPESLAALHVRCLAVMRATCALESVRRAHEMYMVARSTGATPDTPLSVVSSASPYAGLVKPTKAPGVTCVAAIHAIMGLTVRLGLMRDGDSFYRYDEDVVAATGRSILTPVTKYVCRIADLTSQLDPISDQHLIATISASKLGSTDFIKTSKSAIIPSVPEVGTSWYLRGEGLIFDADFGPNHELRIFDLTDEAETPPTGYSTTPLAAIQPQAVPLDVAGAREAIATGNYDHPALATPLFDSLFEAQGLFERDEQPGSPAEYRRHFILAYMGRLYYPARTFENDPAIVMLVGAGGSGKSSATDVLRALMDKRHITDIAANPREQFPLQPTIESARMYMISEMQATTSLPLPILLPLSSGDELVLQIMYSQTSTTFRSRANGLFHGNAYPKCLGIAGGAMLRRTISLHFPHRISGSKHKAFIAAKIMERELSRLAIRLVIAYRTFLKRPALGTDIPTDRLDLMKKMPKMCRDELFRMAGASSPEISALTCDKLFVLQAGREFPFAMRMPKTEFITELRNLSGIARSVAVALLDTSSDDAKTKQSMLGIEVVRRPAHEDWLYNGAVNPEPLWVTGVLPFEMFARLAEETGGGGGDDEADLLDGVDINAFFD